MSEKITSSVYSQYCFLKYIQALSGLSCYLPFAAFSWNITQFLLHLPLHWSAVFATKWIKLARFFIHKVEYSTTFSFKRDKKQEAAKNKHFHAIFQAISDTFIN
ncbi:hypothetical protein [Pseudoalteromonas xiamenensis]|uniref:Uncharacterized protein n=1 Tax=Pseudoalteromonas xiamenensis TaxID=882626 RepID=A0A975HK08_9GAMM|nr:hypothetical protein [Pseudoalteromonas xiamenensis]QTH70541.1 hypothetical protein J5O05_11255 [Pseudoalteromonas xiamenensis]